MKPTYAFLLLLPALLTACRDENSSLGSSLVETSFRNVYVDTCTVDISTVLTDSLVTRDDSLCQVGRYADTTWGEVISTYYAEYNAASFTPSDENEYSMDSLVLHILPSGHYWGDTLARQRIHVYRLAQPIELYDDDDLYNTTSWPLADTPLCSATYLPRPGRGDSLNIRLPDALGQQLLDDIVAQADYLSDQDKFKTVFPGLALTADAEGSCISGFRVNDRSRERQCHLAVRFKVYNEQ